MMSDTEGTTNSMILATRHIVQKVGSYDGIECSVHTLPKPLQREFRHVFGDSIFSSTTTNSTESSLWFSVADNGTTNSPDIATSHAREVLAIPTNQKAREDLVAVGEHIEREKDRLLHVVCSLIIHFIHDSFSKNLYSQ